MGAILGAVGPLLYYTTQPAREFILGNGLFLWPTGLVVMVAYGHEYDFFGYAVTAISVVLNIALYVAAVMLLWFVVRMIVRRLATTKR
jgi:membrane protein implicated in regulation of membrane protease activity